MPCFSPHTFRGAAASNTLLLSSAGTCCGAIMHWRVPFVPSTLGLSVDLNVTSGAVHAVVLQYASTAASPQPPARHPCLRNPCLRNPCLRIAHHS